MKPFSLFLVLAMWVAPVLAGPRDAQWKEVDEAMGKGLPKTAIEKLGSILEGAKADKSYPELVRALGLKIALEGNIEGNKPEEKIFRLQAEIGKAPPETQPLLEAVLAHWYWQYFQHNRWRFLQRTQTAEAPGPDLQTWDLPRILGEIDKHFTGALVGREKLKATPVSAFEGLLVKGNLPDAWRPTLFDFLANEALRFYSAGEQGGAKAEDTFVLAADGPIFAPAAEFMKWKPETTDADSPTLKAVRLYQELLAFHQKDADRTAFADADLNRLDFGHNTATGENKEELYRNALKRFADEWVKHEVSSRALAQWATSLVAEDEPVEAHALAKRGLEAFPKSLGGTLCFNVLAQIQMKSASLQTERVWNAPWPTVNVTYRNVTKVYFRAIPRDFEKHLAGQRWGMFQYDDKFRKNLLAEAPALAWEADLPPTADFRERTEKVPAPKTLKPGFYFILSSHDPAFRDSNNVVSIAPVWVSDMALVMRQRQSEGVIEGLVLKNLPGEPVPNARVRCFVRNSEGWFKPGGQAVTDENGFFRFEGSQRNAFLLLAEAEGQSLATSHEGSTYVNPERKDGEMTVLFTDRALYRPGQTVSYKGIALRYDRAKGDYATVPNRDVLVVFHDPNNKEIAQATHRSNDYGSFSGSFTAPRDRVTGQMRLQAHHPEGAAFVSVEEYKRPKFRVEIERPKEAAKLDAEVAVTGKATAYTGAPIGGAKLKWRVVREVRFPGWWGWCGFGFWPGTGQGQAIAHGTAVSDADGTFTVKFMAKPDRSVPETAEPIFTFTVYADVTDSSGETRSASRPVRAAWTALQASLAADEWQTSEKPVDLTVSTKSLDDEPQAASGKVTVWRLKQPEEVLRPDFQPGQNRWNVRRGRALPPPKPDASDPNTWEQVDPVFEKFFETDKGGATKLAVPLKPGIYRATLESKDRFGKAVTARLPLLVVDPKSRKFPVKVSNRVLAPKWSVEPGEAFTALWGTGYGKGRAFVEIERDGQRVRAFWTAEGRTQEIVEQAVDEEDRGGFTLRVTQVRENRAYFNERIVNVPWSNKQLTLKWEHFTSKLGPGQKETWTAVVTGPDAKRTAAEMVATLYDASLDAYRPNGWPGAFSVFRQEWGGRLNTAFENMALPFQQIFGGWPMESRGYGPPYRAFPPELVANLWGYGFFGAKGMRNRGMTLGMSISGAAGDEMLMARSEVMADSVAAPAAKPMEVNKMAEQDYKERADKSSGAFGVSGGTRDRLGDGGAPQPDLDKVAARKNLNETAFFFPHLLADREGVVRMEFTMPEALTEWRFLGFAHNRGLCAGLLTNTTVTAKDLMVEPNPPRFVREGDTIEFTVKVTNPTDAPQKGKVRLTFADARTLKPADPELGNQGAEQAFEVAAKQSRSYAWRITVPDGMDFLTYKAVGATDRLSDGEEGMLPVLSRRILVTESLPLPVRGKQTKTFEFKKLLESGKSDTLRHQSLTVQMVSQPAWYAVMALPYLMEYPYECSEQTFNRLYANALARHIAASDPKIRRIFDLWKGTPALDSPLEKNQDLKSVMIEETPWLRQAHDESQARRNVGILFDENRLNDESGRAFRKLAEAQLSEGMWPWFPGGRPSEFITLYIATGFGRLRNLGVAADMSLAIRSLGALDAWMDQHYREILKGPAPELYVPSPTDAQYLYGRSFFLKDQPVAAGHQKAVNFFLGQSRKFWLKVDWRMSQAQLALALKRFGDTETPVAILRSIKERSVTNEEMGMFWRELELSWWWFRAPIETQAMMVEAFAEVGNDAQAVEDCKVWLLKQKQTQDWKTTKATADAVYALLLRGTSLLSSDALVEVSLGGTVVQPEKVEAGTGFYEKRFGPGEIKPEQGRVTLKKVDEGVSWGSLHWQYLEDMKKVTPYEGTPLKLKKAIFLRETTKKGQVLKAVNGPLQVGDEVVVRVELRTDRDMEYVHLKDQRGSGTEPVNVLSRTRFQDGLAYYESTRDTASHFFIEVLPKGVYVFEYPVRIQQRGRYQTGIASIQCMYAPEFNSHSESFELEVK